MESVPVLFSFKQSHGSYRRSLEDFEAKGELGSKERGRKWEAGWGRMSQNYGINRGALRPLSGSALHPACPALVPLTYQQALLISKN